MKSFFAIACALAPSVAALGATNAQQKLWENELRATVDETNPEQLMQLHSIIADSMAEVEENYNKRHATPSLLELGTKSSGPGAPPAAGGKPKIPFWKKIFNCQKCQMDDGSTGMTKNDKKKAADGKETLDEKDDLNADMVIGRVYALEWGVFPIPSPWPNAMMAFVCEPTAELLNFGEGAQVPVPLTEEEDKQEQGELSKELRKAGSKHAPPAVDGEEKSMMKVLLSTIYKRAKAFATDLMSAFKQLLNFLFVTVRCAVCVICNLMNIIMDLLKYVQEKLTAFATAGVEMLKAMPGGEDLVNTAKAFLDGPEKRNKLRAEAVKNGNQEAGGYCKEDKHCLSGNCKVSKLVTNQCVGSTSKPETRPGVCGGSNKLECEKMGCKFIVNTFIDDCEVAPQPKKLLLLETESGTKNLAELDMGNDDTTYQTATPEQRINRIVYNMHRHGLLEKGPEHHEEMVRDHIESKHVAKHVLASTMSFLQAHSSQRAEAKGVMKLPNKCVSCDAIGKTITLAINYENPNLMEVLFTFPWDFTKAMPEILVAVSPMDIEGEGIAPACLIGSKESVLSEEEADGMAEASMKGKLDEDENLAMNKKSEDKAV